MLIAALLGLVLGAHAESKPETPAISIPFEEYDLDNNNHTQEKTEI